MKTKILRQLRTTNEYVSGQMLCDELGVSRTAVWKAINQLKEEGYTIEAVQNKGYKITGYPDILTAEEIESQLNPGDTVKKWSMRRKLIPPTMKLKEMQKTEQKTAHFILRKARPAAGAGGADNGYLRQEAESG